MLKRTSRVPSSHCFQRMGQTLSGAWPPQARPLVTSGTRRASFSRKYMTPQTVPPPLNMLSTLLLAVRYWPAALLVALYSLCLLRLA
ncbi:uncharacterized protein DEA37_0013403 [Paragonimus westermani]|uniref:Uncharacterized protein n=1 Tax=Paragonimus westermani TaxID=34504 RepID=A0A5J4NAD0_9TREM|nr:uncharacterized protein DEA37_0013403 [Paragonimus westermani]